MRKTVILLILVAGVWLVGCSYQGPKTSPDQGTTLINTYWKLIETDGVAVTTAADAREAHVILRPDHRVTGFGSCNTFSGTWQMEDELLVIGPLMSTRMACPESATEMALLSALDGKVVTEIEGEVLTVTGRDGIELKFQAMYFE